MVNLTSDEYIFYTTERVTLAPNRNLDIDNCQILGFVKAKTLSKAKELLLQENPWIVKAKFSIGKIMVKQVLTMEQKEDIQSIVDYNWNDEERDYQEWGNNPKNHIFKVLKRLKQMY